jgi:hypothetical protein
MRKSSQPKIRWATRFRSKGQKSQQKPKGPWTHLGPYPKAVEVDESENPLIAAAHDEVSTVSINQNLGREARVLGGVVESVALAPEDVETVLNPNSPVAPNRPVVAVEDGSGGWVAVPMEEKEPVPTDIGFG